MEKKLNNELDCVSYERAVAYFAEFGRTKDVKLGHLAGFGVVWYAVFNGKIKTLPIKKHFDFEKLRTASFLASVVSIEAETFFVHDEKRCFFTKDRKIFHIKMLENSYLLKKLSYDWSEGTYEPVAGLVKMRDIGGESLRDTIQWMIAYGDGPEDCAYFPIEEGEPYTPKSENFVIEALKENDFFRHNGKLFLVDYNESEGYSFKKHPLSIIENKRLP